MAPNVKYGNAVAKLTPAVWMRVDESGADQAVHSGLDWKKAGVPQPAIKAAVE